jgi:hypothetical protein
VVCSIEGPGVLRLFFASKSRAKLIVKRYEIEKPLTVPKTGLTGVILSETFILQIAEILMTEMPSPFFEKPELDRFHSNIPELIGTVLEQIDAAHALPQFLNLVRVIDQQMSSGRKVTDGFAIFFVTFLNKFSSLFDIVLDVCIQRQNFLSFQYLLLFVSNRLSNSILAKPLPRHQIRDSDVLYLLFGYVAEHKLTVHYHLLNLFATISPMEELRIVFSVASITGIQGSEPPKELLSPSLTETFERITGSDFVRSGHEPRLDIGGKQWRSITDRHSNPPKLSIFRCRTVTIAPTSVGVCTAVKGIGVVDIEREYLGVGSISKIDLGLAVTSVGITIICLFVILYFCTFV